MSNCTICNKEFIKIRNIKTCSKECSNELHKYTSDRFRLEALFYYSQGKMTCKCCGESNKYLLTIDHINGDGINDKHRYNLYNYIIKNNFPKYYQILCMNCNKLKTNRNKQFCKVHHPELYLTPDEPKPLNKYESISLNESDNINMNCPKCNSPKTVKCGYKLHSNGSKTQRYQCMNCGKYFGGSIILEESYKHYDGL